MQMQLFGNDVIFSLSCVLVSDNCKQSITVWFFTINVLFTDSVLKLGRAYQCENCLTTTNCACRRCDRSSSPTACYTQNGWASADFLNSAQLQRFVRLTEVWKWWHSRQVLVHEKCACTVCRGKTVIYV